MIVETERAVAESPRHFGEGGTEDDAEVEDVEFGLACRDELAVVKDDGFGGGGRRGGGGCMHVGIIAGFGEFGNGGWSRGSGREGRAGFFTAKKTKARAEGQKERPLR